MDKFYQIITEVYMTLDLCSKLRFAQYPMNKWMDFDKILCFGIH